MVVVVAVVVVVVVITLPKHPTRVFECLGGIAHRAIESGSDICGREVFGAWIQNAFTELRKGLLNYNAKWVPFPGCMREGGFV